MVALAVAKLAITAALVVIISEVARRYSFAGAVIASLPVVSVLAMTWLYLDEHDVDKVAKLATGTFWMVIPSLVLFIVLPLLLKRNVNFFVSLGLACTATAVSYLAMVFVLTKVGIKL